MKEIAKLLPGFNCGECGFKNCREFARALLKGKDLDLCPFLGQERHLAEREEIEEILPRLKQKLKDREGRAGEEVGDDAEAEIRGVIDGLAADFALAPLPGEPACREDIHPFDRDAEFEVGDVLRYRPLGCPVTHFGEIIKIDHGLVTVHMVGPRHLLGDENFAPKDVGVCMVAAFEGVVSRGRVPEVGETVSFLPEHCMMQKVHSGMIVHSEGRMVRIESIDLKVW
ncbi:MAG TPA: (Fe-S)-binding protein [Methanothrix sp.]|nr:(Fe-S)-binding protein [Methanothrix sp.]HPR65499.1 (Fe-S)-binding protein [Methanothrix sp.]